MKNKNLIPVVFFVILIFSACDFITDVYKPQPPPPPPTDSTRRILLEDYTGHFCNNCPSAASEADSIQHKYPDRVIVMGVHVNKGFAAPHKNDEFKADFRTVAGNTYDEENNFNMSKGGLPKGMINRKNYKPSSLEHILLYGSWDEVVYREIKTSPNAIVKLDIENEYDTSDRKLNVTIKSTFFYDTIKTSAYSLVVCIMESGIVSPQLNGNDHILDYVHNHVLRDNINGTWGKELVAKGKIEKSKELTKTYAYTFPIAYPYPIAPGSEWSQTACLVENCHIVAYIYNNDTKEVVQVSEAKVIK